MRKGDLLIVAVFAGLLAAGPARAQEDVVHDRPVEPFSKPPSRAGEEEPVFEPKQTAAFSELYEHPLKGREAFVFERDGYRLSVNLFGQVQGAAWVGEKALIENWDPATTEGFRLRRARIGFHGTAHKWLGLNLVVDMFEQEGGGNTISTAAIVAYPLPELNIVAGTAPLPFSRGSMTSSSTLQMIERPVSVTQLSPPSQLGAAFMGGIADGVLEYAVGAYNGGTGYVKGDVGKGLLYAARLQVSPLGPMPAEESDLWGSPLRVSLGCAGYFSNDSSIETTAASADIRIKWHGFSLLGEVLWDRRVPQDKPVLPETLPDTVERLGWYVQGGAFVLPGLLELAGRYEWYDDQRSLPDAGDLWLASGGLNVFLAKGLFKLQVNYIRKVERKVPDIPNDIVFGQVQVNL